MGDKALKQGKSALKGERRPERIAPCFHAAQPIGNQGIGWHERYFLLIMMRMTEQVFGQDGDYGHSMTLVMSIKGQKRRYYQGK